MPMLEVPLARVVLQHFRLSLQTAAVVVALRLLVLLAVDLAAAAVAAMLQVAVQPDKVTMVALASIPGEALVAVAVAVLAALASGPGTV